MSFILNLLPTSFAEQLAANLAATILAGVFLYIILEKNVSDKLRRDNANKMLKNLAGDLSYNYVSADKVLQKQEEYLSGNRFTLNRFRTDYLVNFSYQKPFEEKDKFPYVRLMALIKKFEENNILASLVYNNNDHQAVLTNKKEYFSNIAKLKKDIVDFLNDINPFFLREKIILTEFS